MNLQDWITVIGILGGLLAIAGYLWGVGKAVRKWLNPKWRGFLLSRGRVECPKCSEVFVPEYYNARYTGNRVAKCPKCETETDEGYWYEPPPMPEPDEI
ncbi:MAG: hypothetical protein JRM73_04780 [Nitrososphaerota archaeon]|nr:hypothetical protein [Nitrososphaerota archaeon]